MSRNGYEGGMDETSDDRDSVDTAEETPLTAAPPSASPPGSPKPRQSRARSTQGTRTSKPPKVAAKAEGAAPRRSRKSAAPKSRRSESVAPPSVRVRNGAKTVAYAPGENPATLISAGFQRDEDDISIPPTSGELEEQEEFFAAAARIARSEPPPRVVAGRAHSDDVADRALTPIVPPERRRLLANVVKGAVAISGVLCLAALVRVSLGHRAHAATSSAAAQVVSSAPVAKVTEAAPVAVDPSPAPAAAETEPTAPLKPASEEREDARHALETGKVQDAIDAAQRSLTVDPTDAEAWLILGAAQLDLGHGAEAHDAFNQCTKQAKTGNVGECGAMLRWNGPPR